MEQPPTRHQLSRPLLGTEAVCCDCAEYGKVTDDVATGMMDGGCCCCCKEDDEDEDDLDQWCGCDVHSTTCCDTIILWLVLPALLFVQFGIAFTLDSTTPVDAFYHNHSSMVSLEWSTVNYSIFLFVLSSYLFRQTLQEMCCYRSSSNSSSCCTFWFLLPEIIMDLLLALILFGAVVPAFLIMVLSTMALSGYTVVCSVTTLCETSSPSLLYEEEEEDEESLVC
jgi:hypothetical protein